MYPARGLPKVQQSKETHMPRLQDENLEFETDKTGIVLVA
jgi:hypothetical protein